ncbi:MAG: hypothetical protein NTY86_09380 [Deltaproteobacteria bacterium]|nr:hypothetical protein [Deltaproteobacteria bacterium]
MINLHPLPESQYRCPFDDTKLDVLDWYIPGMRNLADLRCPKCGREFYGDLPAGHGLYWSMLLDKKTGDVHDLYNIRWFADWLRNSYANRSDEPLEFVTEDFRPLQTPLLLNCLDTLYGHCLLKLLNAQYYLDKRPDLDLVVLVPKCLRWMVPDGTAAIWTVDLPLRRGTEWNDWLAAAISTRLKQFAEVWLSVAYSHPHPKDFAIERFTRVHPFPLDKWHERLEAPKVTFVWREDRLWGDQGNSGRLRRLANRMSVKIGLGGLSLPRREQTRRVVLLATRLRKAFPKLNFAVVGLGVPGDMPHWIEDLRTTTIDTAAEKAWCDRYAYSHVVIGIHGSNMLLPSAHAGATIELMPSKRWGNMIQDLLMPDLDCREALFRYRIVPVSASVKELTFMIVSLLHSYLFMERDFRHCLINHDPDNFTEIRHRRFLYQVGSS